MLEKLKKFYYFHKELVNLIGYILLAVILVLITLKVLGGLVFPIIGVLIVAAVYFYRRQR